MQTIGFTEKFYTLWEVGDIVAEPVHYNGIEIGVNYMQRVNYIQNLSFDLEAAKSKLVGPYEIDLELRGHSSFNRLVSSNIKDRENYYKDDCLSFGKMEGVRFVDVTDIWQLNRAFREEKSGRRRARARRRLIELGALIRYRLGNYNYASQEEIDMDFIAKNSGHHFSDGQKVELEIEEIRRGGFEGFYGWTSIVTYKTACGKVVKYMGSSSPYLKQEGFTKVRATIKHDNYNGKPETKLQRIKVLN